ncbi:hypothetical protein BU15DRAFT_72341 [Melanogaster broomeanus]|nr:hypothetical protein BU15DRAFT_72341 [Melanogaster broomeanus]
MARMMDSPKLRRLTRTQVQSIAKREFVRAVGKTEDIIRRLIKKHPKGVPVPEDVDKSPTSSATRKRNVLKKARTGAIQAAVIPEAINEEDEGVIVKDEPHGEPSSEILPDPSMEVPAVSPQVTAVHPSGSEPAIPSEQPPADSAPVFNAPGARPSEVSIEESEDEDDARSVCSDDPRAAGGPDENMVVDCLRQFTTLVNTAPIIESRIAESQRLLNRTAAILDKTTPEVRELCVTREYLEVFVMGNMKKKKELWDGTGKMKKGPRKFRMEWLRSERKAENMKRWQEANKTNAAQGYSPEPYELFASDSEDDIIESLQTTPTNSRCGSPKRGREEAADTDNDRRKRSRS